MEKIPSVLLLSMREVSFGSSRLGLRYSRIRARVCVEGGGEQSGVGSSVGGGYGWKIGSPNYQVGGWTKSVVGGMTVRGVS